MANNPWGRAGKPKPAEENEMAEAELDIETNEAAEQSVDITQTPEFQMALGAERVRLFEEAKAQARAELAAVAPTSAPLDSDSDIMKLARAFAMSTAEMADQGTNRKRISPEILEARRLSEKKLYQLLDEAQNLPDSQLPVYTVISQTYMGDRLIEPFYADPSRKGVMVPQQVVFCSIPNFALKPENKSATAIYEAWLGTMAGSNGMTETPWGSMAQKWDPLNAKPVWMTDKGRLLSVSTATAREHGITEAPELPTFGVSHGPQVEEQMSIHDPRRTNIPVLGTIAPPATRGSSDPRLNVR